MRYILGLDGGGSKTICLAADVQGRLAGCGTGGPANTNYTPRATAVESLRQAIQAALAHARLQGEQIDSLCVSAPAEPGVVEEARRAAGIRRIFRAPEGETPRWAARFWVKTHVGVTVDAGTGSMARGWSRDGRLGSAGGWGALLGDEGSGYWIGIQAMRAILQAQDGRIEPTRLTQAVMSFFRMHDVLDLVFHTIHGPAKPNLDRKVGVAPDSGHEQMQDEERKSGGLFFREFSQRAGLSRDEIASLCPIVVQVALQGDQKAIEILRSAGEELGKLGGAVVKRLEMETDEFAILPYGGVFRAGDLVLDSFRETILSMARRACVIAPPFEPVVGAVLLALNDAGAEISPQLLRRLEDSAHNFPGCKPGQEAK